MADYSAKANLNTKILDFVQLGGEMITTKNLCWSVCSIAGGLAHSAGCVICVLPSAGTGKLGSVGLSLSSRKASAVESRRLPVDAAVSKFFARDRTSTPARCKPSITYSP